MKNICILLILILSLTGCSNQDSSITKLEETLVDLNDEISQLKNDLEETKKKNTSQFVLINDLTDRISQNENDINYLNQINFPDAINLSINSSGFTLLNNQFGVFAILIENVEEYLNGYKLEISVGNLMNTEFSNVEFHFVFPEIKTYSSLVERIRDIPDINLFTYTDYKNITHKETKSLKSGSWTTISVNLQNITLEELEDFYIIPEFSTISLNN